MKKYIVYLFVIGLILNIGCKTEKKDTQEEEVDMSKPEIPGIPEDVMLKLLNECTYFDYIFKELPFALSQDEPPSIKQNILFIDNTRPLVRIPKRCKSDGRKFFHIKGEIVYEADVYILNGCNFYVFVDKSNKPIYANYITQEGVNFYANIINQAKGMAQ